MLSGFFAPLFSHPEPSACENIFDEIEAVLERHTTFEKNIENNPDKVAKQIAFLEKTYQRLQPFNHKDHLQALGLNDALLDSLPSGYLDDLTFELLDIVILISGPNSTTPYTIGLHSLMSLISAAKRHNRDIEHPYRGPINAISIDREKTLEINEFSRQLTHFYSAENPLTEVSLSEHVNRFSKSDWRQMLEFKWKTKRNQEQLQELNNQRETLVKRIENADEKKIGRLIEQLENIDDQINQINSPDKNPAELKKTLNHLILEQANDPDNEEPARTTRRLLATTENRSGLLLLLTDRPEDKPKKTAVRLPML